MRISDWSSDVCSSDLRGGFAITACNDTMYHYLGAQPSLRKPSPMCLPSSRARLFDVMGVGLSFACLIHCLVLPLVLLLAPALSAWLALPEAFHAAILLLAAPDDRKSTRLNSSH